MKILFPIFNTWDELEIAYVPNYCGGYSTIKPMYNKTLGVEGKEMTTKVRFLKDHFLYGLFKEDTNVILTEKVHGTNTRYVFDGETFHVGSHTTWKMKPGILVKTITMKDEVTGEDTIKEIFAPPSAYWNAIEQHPWIEAWCRNHPGMVLYGEVYGPNVQGANFTYGKKQGEFGFAVFDVLDHGKWVVNGEMFDNPKYSDGMGETVKILYRGPLDVELLKKMAEEDSAYPGQKVREGIVVKLEKEERNDVRHGRIALKYVSDRYLMMK